MVWLWLNIGICAPIFLAITGIPLWMVIRHPDRGPASAVYKAQDNAPLRPAPTATSGVASPTSRLASEAGQVPQSVAVAA